MSDAFVSAVCRSLSALRPPSRVLIAVSGGADSVALLDALSRGRDRREMRRFTFIVGHFDHRMRSDSSTDRDLVARLAGEREVIFDSREAIAPIVKGPSGVEESARTVRYEALQSMAMEHRCLAIATGHTASDQAETLLWRLIRGSGARGLGAMRPRRKLGKVTLIRPLLGLTREETRAYCSRHQLAFGDDPTNENELPRARLRAEVLPVMERLAPGATRRIADAAGRLRADDDWIDAHAKAAVDDVEALAELPEPVRRRALAWWFARETGTRRRLASTHLLALDALVRTGRGTVDLPSGGGRLIAEVQDGQLKVNRTSKPLRVACRPTDG